MSSNFMAFIQHKCPHGIGLLCDHCVLAHRHVTCEASLRHPGWSAGGHLQSLAESCFTRLCKFLLFLPGQKMSKRYFPGPYD
jgi:hypothetical protein